MSNADKPSTAMAQSRTAIQGLNDQLFGSKARILALVGGSEKEAERLINSALIAAAENASLLDCDPRSIKRSVLQAAMIGADLTAGRGHGWLIPRKNRRKGITECSFQDGYRLWMDKIVEAGYQPTCGEIRENDVWSYQKAPLQFTHEQDPFATQEARGDFKGAYCAVYRIMPSGERVLVDVELLGMEELDKSREGARKRNYGKESPAWQDWGDRMYFRLPIKRVAKRLDLSDHHGLQKLLEVSAVAEATTLDADFDEVGDADVAPSGALSDGPHWGFGNGATETAESGGDRLTEAEAKAAVNSAAIAVTEHVTGTPEPDWDAIDDDARTKAEVLRTAHHRDPGEEG